MTTAADSALERIQQLKSQGEAGARELLKAALEERDAAARGAAARALAEIPGFDAASPLIEALADSQRHIKSAAAEALGDLGDKRAVEPLLQASKDFEILVRLKAIESLGKLKDQRATDPLTRCLRDRNTPVRVMAAEALGRLEDPKAIDPLLIAMAEANNDMRKAAMGATSNDPAARAMQDGNKKLAEDAWLVQWSVASALGKIGGPRAVDALIAWSHRIFTSETKKISADEKARVVRDAARPMLQKMEDADLRALQNRLQASTRIKSWQSLSTVTDLFDWIEAKRDNPVWTAIIEEMERRRPAASAEGATTPADTGVRSVAELLGRVPKSQASATPASAPVTPPPGDSQPSAPIVAAPAAAAPPTPPPAPTRYADPSGLIGDFISFLKASGMESVVVLGGALRSPAIGREPNDIDITFQLIVSDDLKRQLADPIAWNMQFAPQVHPPLSQLAERLGCSLKDLIDGKALYFHQGKSIAIHYVGPFLIEERETVGGRYRAGQCVRQTISRLALVADELSNRVVGLVSTSAFEQAWIDSRGRQCGNVKGSLEELARRRIRVEIPAAKPGLLDISHIIFCKAAMRGTLDDNAIDLLESASAAVKQFPDLTLEDFSQADFERLVSICGLEEALKAFDLLGLTELIVERFDDTMQDKIQKLRGAAPGGGIEAQQAKLEAQNALAEAEGRKELFEARTAELNQYGDELDEAKAAIAKLEADLKNQVPLLAAADAENRAAGARLEKAMTSFREMTTKGGMDLPVIQEHREALAAKRQADSDFLERRNAVEDLRGEIEKRQRASSRLRNEMERIGHDLESALREYQEAQAAATAAEERLRKLDGNAALPPHQRRELLRGAPAA